MEKNVYYSNKGNYISSYVGGKGNLDDDKETNINQKKSIINNNILNFDKAKEEKSDYNEYHHYLAKNGLLNPNKISNYKNKYLVEYENINSGNRMCTPICSVGTSILLNSNPFKFVSVTTNGITMNKYLSISADVSNLSVNDNITLTGLNNFTNIIKFTYDSNIIFSNTKSYVKICINPNIQTSNLQNLINNAAMYDFSNVTVTITGFQGSSKNNTGSSGFYFGNYPINLLNNTFQIYLSPPNTTIPSDYDLSYFYIVMPYNFDSSYLPNTPYDGYNITFQFNHICGVPINIINAQYPLNINYLLGYQTIYSIKSNSFLIELQKQWLGDNNGISFGGNLIYYSKVEKISTGYPNPNNYNIKLSKEYKKLIGMRIINSVFPASENVFSSTNYNLCLYWQNKSDGNTIYKITITPGTYDTASLKNEIETKIASVPKIPDPTVFVGGSLYLPNNYITVDFNINNNITKFSSYNKYIFVNPPILSIVPIRLDIVIQNQTQTISSYTMTIVQPNHNMMTGDTITFSGMLTTLFTYADSTTYAISETALNSTFNVNAVSDINTYTVIISNVNVITNPTIISTITCTNGGYNVIGLVKSYFRLLFNSSDTIGTNIGFRNVGDPLSITPYKTDIKNTDPYYNEKSIDLYNNPVNFYSGRINLNRTTYFVINCDEITGKLLHYYTNSIHNIIGKINCSKIRNGNYYDTFVDMPITFHEPIDLYSLTFTFYSPDAKLYDFGNEDHSFVLELVSITERPDETYIDSNTGIEY